MDRPGDVGATAADEDGRESEPPLRLSLETIIEGGDWGDSAALEALVARAGCILATAPEIAARLGDRATACVAFSRDAEVRGLNARYRAKDKPTNVLSFPAPPLSAAARAAGEPNHLGDVVLAAETVAAEASELGIPLADHIQHLVIHGVLHLAGYDHETDAEADAMEALEARLLARLGVADPYRRNE